MSRTPAPPSLRTAPVLAILVCHNGADWLPDTLAALRRSTLRPRHVLAVNTGSSDDTADLLNAAVEPQDVVAGPDSYPPVDRVLTLDRRTGFAAAVNAGVQDALEHWGDPGAWIWVLHDDSAPEPDCLDILLRTAEASASASVLGPLALDWADPRLIVEAGLSLDASGHRHSAPFGSRPATSRRGKDGGEGDGAENREAGGGLFERSDDPVDEDSGPEPSGNDVEAAEGDRANENGGEVANENGSENASAAETGGDPAAPPDPDTDNPAAPDPDTSDPDTGTGRASGATAWTAESEGGMSEQSTEVLAVPSAGMLIRRELWESLGGFDPGFPLLREDIDLGWRANAAGRLVLCVPSARVRHARALSTGLRNAGALTGTTAAAADRTAGLRAFLVNCSTPSFLLGVPRLILLCLLRGLGFLLLGRLARMEAELAAAGYLLRGRGGLRAARAHRRTAGKLGRGPVRGLFAGRLRRLRTALRALVLTLVRRRVASEADLGRLPETSEGDTAWIPPEPVQRRDDGSVVLRQVGPDALPAGAGSRVSGLRRPARVVAVSLPEHPDPAHDDPETAGPRRPSPGAGADDGLVFVELNRRRVLAATLFAPPVVLVVLLLALGLVLNGGRLGLDLAGGRLLPVGGLGQVWSEYLASWHGVAGGTVSSAPASLAVLGLLGALFAPVGGPAALVAVLLIAEAPISALIAYLATRRLRVRRWVRAGVAAAYALVPAATASVAQGRLDVVLVHLVLPMVLAGIAGVLVRSDARWLPSSVLCALGVALLGAFSPLAHALALLGLVLGFVLLPAPSGLPRRIASVGIVVVLPLALLLPWPTTLLRTPALLLHGLSGPGVATSGGDLAGLDPGGVGGWPTGLIVVAAAVVALVVRPSGRAGAGLAVLALGGAGLAVVRLVPVDPLQGGARAPGYAGTPLLIISAGLLWLVLSAFHRDWGGSSNTNSTLSLPPVLVRAGAVAGVVLLLALAAGALLAGRQGPVRADGGDELNSSLTVELADTGRSVLVLGAGGEPARQRAGGLPGYGDEQFAPVRSAPDRLSGWQRDLLSGTPEQARQVLGSALAAGVLFVVLPPGVDAGPYLQLAPELAGGAPPTRDGRQVLRLLPLGGQVTLISPELAKLAVTAQPPVQPQPGVAQVPADLPSVRVRVSAGPTGRLLVLAAEQEAGWQASVNGQRVPIVPAWGHQVAVSVPPESAEVTVEHPSALRNILLLAQVAAVLFALLTVVPAGGRGARETGDRTGSRPRAQAPARSGAARSPAQSPSMTSGSTPR